MHHTLPEKSLENVRAPSVVFWHGLTIFGVFSNIIIIVQQIGTEKITHKKRKNK